MATPLQSTSWTRGPNGPSIAALLDVCMKKMLYFNIIVFYLIFSVHGFGKFVLTTLLQPWYESWSLSKLLLSDAGSVLLLANGFWEIISLGYRQFCPEIKLN
jgi:hypothetical protein